MLIWKSIANLSDLNTHKTLGDACINLGLPEPSDEGSKRERLEGSFDTLLDSGLSRVAERVLDGDLRLDAETRNSIQDELWTALGTPEIPKKTRHEISRDFDVTKYAYSSDRFMTFLASLWVLGEESPFDFLLGSIKGLHSDIVQHVFRNPGDWSTEYLFEQLGAFEASDTRFVRFIEGLVSADIIPDEVAQRNITDILNKHLQSVGVELRQVNTDGGYPVFGIVSTQSARNRRPKNLIFASPTKPDLRFVNAIDNDIEIVGASAANVLVYDRPIGNDGLRWCDLQAWWKETQSIGNDVEAKKTLYARLAHSLPVASPPQQNLFSLYHEINGSAIPSLPVLLPEVWLHWDHKTVKERGRDALLRFRMDFLLLLPQQQRVVIEVDGAHHFTDSDGRPSSTKYAANVRGDRDLKLSGYEVFRFGAAELQDRESARAMLQPFFVDLFRRFSVSPRKDMP